MSTKYQLTKSHDGSYEPPLLESLQKLWALMGEEKKSLISAFIAIVASSVASLTAPLLIAYSIDTFIIEKNYSGLLISASILVCIYSFGAFAQYFQTRIMGGIGRHILFRLRNSLFTKLQSFPLAFFDENTTGDLISRINNDTDKLNQFFAQAFTQFLGNFLLVAGSGIFLLILNLPLGSFALFPAICVLLISRWIGPWVKEKNFLSLQSTGSLSAIIQESLNNFQSIVAFHRMDYFVDTFQSANEQNYRASFKAGVASNIFTPLYSLASNLWQLIILVFGIVLVSQWHITLGLFISFQFYLNNFYSPLRQLASVWSSLQLALASLDRIREVLEIAIPRRPFQNTSQSQSSAILEFHDVSFHYDVGKNVLSRVNFSLKTGKTYAFVGPTGWWKTTTALLMSRLYNPQSGSIFLLGKDIRIYSEDELTRIIWFILQEPFLFSGTVGENIVYGHPDFHTYSKQKLQTLLTWENLSYLLHTFEKGIETYVTLGGESISLWQKQIIAFMRAILRKPKILILDEATANIDTVTEDWLGNMLHRLPKDTVKIIIAHRLNTIENADEIFFVNGGTIEATGDLEQAFQSLMKRPQKT